jgi:FixJ family two-component response regulator
MLAIIDDDASIRTAIESFVESYEMPVRSFPSAEAFLATVDFSALCCVVTDIHMPGMNGLELLKILKTNYSSVPVFLMTAFFDDAIRQSALANGASGFFLKPFRMIDLMRQIELKLPDCDQDD